MLPARASGVMRKNGTAEVTTLIEGLCANTHMDKIKKMTVKAGFAVSVRISV
jgi:predicted XRE-type DNA-binding protein